MDSCPELESFLAPKRFDPHQFAALFGPRKDEPILDLARKSNLDLGSSESRLIKAG